MDRKAGVMSPLADPVVSAIFADKEKAGLAIVSLINAVLEEDGEAIQIEKIISITPQRQYNALMQRGCRIDIEVVAKNNERIIIEIQMTPEHWILERDLFSASRIFTETSEPGDTSKQMAKRLPRIIVINILNFLLRKDNADVMQPAKIMFTKSPQRVAVHNLKIYNVQLPAIEKMKEDFDNAWYCWFYALNKANSENKTLDEVIAMTPQLQAYSKRDAGFRQYCDRYGRVSSDPEIRKEYLDWFEIQMRIDSVEETAKEELREREENFKREIKENFKREMEEKLQTVLAEKDAEIADALAEKDAEIAELRAKLGNVNG